MRYLFQTLVVILVPLALRICHLVSRQFVFIKQFDASFQRLSTACFILQVKQRRQESR